MQRSASATTCATRVHDAHNHAAPLVRRSRAVRVACADQGEQIAAANDRDEKNDVVLLVEMYKSSFWGEDAISTYVAPCKRKSVKVGGGSGRGEERRPLRIFVERKSGGLWKGGERERKKGTFAKHQEPQSAR